MKWLAIINPRADHHSPAQLQELGKDLRTYAHADCTWTSCPQEARQIALKNHHYDGFIAVGGDGTISEVINGMNCARHAFAFVPAGTGNGLARDLNLQEERLAVRVLARPRFHNLDLVSVRFRTRRRWHQRWMVSNAAVGYVAGAVALGMKPWKRVVGPWIYAVAAVLQSFCQDEFPARWRVDDEAWQEGPLTSLIVQNTQHMGQFRMFPAARVDDGKFDLLHACLGWGIQLSEDYGILRQSYQYQRSVRRQACRFQVHLPHPQTLIVDGDESFDHVDWLHFQVVSGRLRCCIGAESGAGVASAPVAHFSGNGVREAVTEALLPDRPDGTANSSIPATMALNPAMRQTNGSCSLGKLSPRQTMPPIPTST